MKKKKILFLVNDLYLGGAQRVVVSIIKNLPRDLFDISLVILFKKQSRADLSQEIINNGVRLVVLNAPSFFGTHKKIIEILREESPDIVHAHLPLSVIHAALVKLRHGGFSLVTHEHNSPLFYSWKIRTALFFSWLLAARVVCYSSAIKKELVASYGLILPQSKVAVIPNGIQCAELTNYRKIRDAQRLSLEIPSDSFVAVSAARLVDWKGHDVLIRAFHQLLGKTSGECFLLIIGNGPEHKNLIELRDKLDLKNKIRIIQETADPYEVMACGDVFVSAVNLPLGFEHLEAAGLSALEAMAIGMPVILSKYPTTHSFVKEGQTVLHVQPGNSGQLAEVLLRLKNDPTLRMLIGQNAANAVQSLDWSQLIKTYSALYSEIIKE